MLLAVTDDFKDIIWNAIFCDGLRLCQSGGDLCESLRFCQSGGDLCESLRFCQSGGDLCESLRFCQSGGDPCERLGFHHFLLPANVPRVVIFASNCRVLTLTF